MAFAVDLGCKNVIRKVMDMENRRNYEKRRKILEDNILSELTELGMSKARFCINFSKIDDIDNCKFNSANGIDEIEFLFSDEYERFKLLKLELLKHSENNLLKFDLNYSFKNIKFFDNKQIPKFNIPEPDGVHGTTYCAQLEMIDSLGEEVAEIIKGNKI